MSFKSKDEDKTKFDLVLFLPKDHGFEYDLEDIEQKMKWFNREFCNTILELGFGEIESESDF